MKISYYPKSAVNQYSENTISILEKISENKVHVIEPFRVMIKQPKTFIQSGRSDVCIVNWLENSLRSKNGKLSILGVLKFFVKLIYFRVRSKKIVYVRHNMYPHGMKGFHKKIAKIITDFAEFTCSLKVTHSGHFKGGDYFYIPHPLYKTFKSDTDGNSEYFVIFGRIDEYKKIDEIISAWDDRYKLLIVGKCESNSYLDKLHLIAKNRNVELRSDYVSDNKASNIVANSMGLIIAHSDKDMIVSGSFFYAVSLGVPVLALEGNFFTWLKKEYSFSGLFLYKNHRDLIENLSDTKAVHQEKIKSESEEIFGDEIIANCWKSGLRTINLK